MRLSQHTVCLAPVVAIIILHTHLWACHPLRYHEFQNPAAHCCSKWALLLQLPQFSILCLCETQFAHASKVGHLNHTFIHAGSLCSSGRQQLASRNADAFSRGSTDDFALHLRHMGQLQELHIWHNGTGLATAWHLSLIIVADETTRERYYA